MTEEAAFVADLNTGDDWRFTNELAATAALSTRLSLKVSHKLSYLNEPVPGSVKPTRSSRRHWWRISSVLSQ